MPREYTFLATKSERQSTKRMRTSMVVKTFQKQWFQKVRERVIQGEPFIFAHVMTPHEILVAMDIPFVVNTWWFSLIAAKRMSAYYEDLVAKRGYELCPYSSTVTLGEAMDRNPDRSPWGGLPQFTAIINSEEEGCSSAARIHRLWAHENNVPVFTLEQTASPPYYQYPRWWEKIKDNWDEVIEPHRIDYRVEELKALIKFLEVITGRTFSQRRLMEVMELVNEQEGYWRKARDLIAKTLPSPVDIVDHLACYPAQWHRGTSEGRDLAKMFYEEVKERVDNSEAAYPNERFRLQWVKSGLFGNTSFYQYFAEKHGAVFVCSWFLSVAADGYARSCRNDPLRALAGRHLFEGIYAGPGWDLKEARLHRVNGALMMDAKCHSGAGGVPRRLTKLAYEAAGIPMLLVDSSWDADRTGAEISEFIERRLS